MHRYSLALIIFVISACGGRSQIGSSFTDGGGSTDSAPAVKCDKPLLVASAAQLAGELNKLQWQSIAKYTSELQQVSRDFQVSANLELDSTMIKLPTNCTPGSGWCWPQAAFNLASSISGVSCLKPETVAWLQACSRLTIKAGTTLRFRGRVIDTHPAKYNSAAIMDLVPRCETPCQAGEHRCAATQTCYADHNEYCRLCMVKDKQVCACETAKGPRAAGDSCMFPVSGDVMCSGTCKKGICEASFPGAGC